MEHEDEIDHYGYIMGYISVLCQPPEVGRRVKLSARMNSPPLI
jgi:hypothetical protein